MEVQQGNGGPANAMIVCQLRDQGPGTLKPAFPSSKQNGAREFGR
jgi:hypothetical protein